MTLPAFASEKEFQSAVVDLARRCGFLVFHVIDSRKSTGVGFPDLVMCHRETGRVIFAELKGHRGRVSEQQWEWLTALSKGNAESALWKPEDWPAIRDTLTQERRAAA